MIYFANSQHIYLLSKLTFCITILVHQVLLYMVVTHGSHVKDGWDLVQREPTVAFVSHHVLPYVDVPHFIYVRQGSASFKRSISMVGCCPCSDKCMGPFL
jgi:hypothetical protein